jgi:hypothetical protein
LRYRRTASRQRLIAATASSTQRANIAAAANRYPNTLKQQRFNTVNPWLAAAYNTPVDIGQSREGPAIDASPIWGEQQIQGRVNQMRGTNDAATAGRQRQMQQQVAGRGFGSQSPLAQALTPSRATRTKPQ